MEGYIAEIRLFAANFAPRNWGYCNGAILSIAQNTALFSLLGTTYGGNGQTTFGLPDFRSRTAVGTGTGQGLSPMSLGQMSGTETVTLNITQMPAHIHSSNGNVTPQAFNGGASDSSPVGNFPANSPTLYANTHNVVMGATPASVAIGPTGNSSPHFNIQPSLGMNYIICLYGIFPSRN
jgi:microcystin-dependent protein